METIYRAVSVEAFRLPVSEKTWVVVARGEVRTSGWSCPQLVLTGEEDDHLVLDFRAQPPKKGARILNVITPIVAVDLVSPGPKTKGLIVSSASISIRAGADILAADGQGGENHDFVAYEIDQGMDEADDNNVGNDDVRREDGVVEPAGAGFSVLASDSYTTCDERTLLKIPLYPQLRERRWRFYRRWRYSVTKLRTCYPAGADEAVRTVLERCLPISLAAGVAGFAAGGPAGAVSAFKAALAGCASAEVVRLVSVRVDVGEEWGPWRRI